VTNTKSHRSPLFAAALALAFASRVLAGQPDAAKPSASTIDWNKERQFWSFKVPQAQPKPAV